MHLLNRTTAESKHNANESLHKRLLLISHLPSLQGIFSQQKVCKFDESSKAIVTVWEIQEIEDCIRSHFNCQTLMQLWAT